MVNDACRLLITKPRSIWSGCKQFDTLMVHDITFDEQQLVENICCGQHAHPEILILFYFNATNVYFKKLDPLEGVPFQYLEHMVFRGGGPPCIPS